MSVFPKAKRNRMDLQAGQSPAREAADRNDGFPEATVGREALAIVISPLPIDHTGCQLRIDAKAFIGIRRQARHQFVLPYEIAEAVEDRVTFVDFQAAQQMGAVSD